MNSAKMKPLSPILERHTPQHPLPDELKEMSRDSTVCQFCGVSYLIHHEIKKLEEKVAQMEAELAESKEAALREPKLREELEKNKAVLETYHGLLKEKDSIIESITNEIESLRKSNADLLTKFEKEQLKCKASDEKLSNLKSTMEQSCLQLQTNTISLKHEFQQMKSDILQTMAKASNALQEDFVAMSSFATAQSNNRKKFDRESEALKQQVLKLRTELQESHKLVQNGHNKKDEEIADLCKQLDIMGQKYKSDLKDLNTKYKETTDIARLSEMKITSYQTQHEQMEVQLRKIQFDHNKALAKLKTTEETADKTIQRLNKESRQLEKELAACKEELRKLNHLRQETQKEADEVNRAAHLNSGQLEQMKAALKEAKSSQKALQQERELMVQSHQNQIEQLRENFKKKLAAADSATNAQKELQVAEERHREAINALERKLKEDFRITLSVEEDKHAEAMQALKSQYKQDMREVDDEHQQQLQPYKNEVSSLMQQFEMVKNQMKERSSAFGEEKQSLMKMISQLEEKITKLTSEEDDRAALNKLELVSNSQRCSKLEQENLGMQSQISTMKEEINVLQTTVQQECEERFELAEALSNAREQLVNKAPGLTFSQSFTSPVSVLNRIPTRHSKRDHDPSYLSGQTLRNLEQSTPSPRGPGHTLPSLRSLPDILPKGDTQQRIQGKTHGPNAGFGAASKHVQDISFGSNNGNQHRSHSTGSTESPPCLNGSGKSAKRTASLNQSKSADNVDNVRRRIAAAVKRKEYN